MYKKKLPMHDDCVFCKIVNGEIPARKVYEDDQLLAFLDIEPINIGHTLVIPKEHYGDLLNTPDDVVADMFRLVKKLAPAITGAVAAPGFNVGVNTGAEAGQVIFHTHVHVMPRFTDDGHRHWEKRAVAEEAMNDVERRIRDKMMM